MVQPAAAAGAGGAVPLWYEGEDGLRHVGDEVGVVVLQHARPVQRRRFPRPKHL
jgi:hypothetical protein